MEITKGAIEVWGANRVGVRLSPHGIANGSGEPDPMPLYTHAIQSLDPLGLAYLHFIEPRSSGAGRAEANWQNVPIGDGAVPTDLAREIDCGRRFYRRGRGCRDQGGPCRRYRVRPHLHFQP